MGPTTCALRYVQCDTLIRARPAPLAHTFQIVNYRDHKPQDQTYVYKFNPFTSNIAEVQEYLKGLTGRLVCEWYVLMYSGRWRRWA